MSQPLGILMPMKIRLVLLLVCVIPVLALAQGSSSDDIAKLRDQIAAEQKQIDDLKSALDAQQQALTKALEQTPTPSSVAAAPGAKVPLDENGNPIAPLSFGIGSAEFTPSGFMDFTAVWRNRDVGSGIGTSFGSIPFGNTQAGKMPETRFSAQNSRIGLAVNEKVKDMDIMGYVEADFLGTAPSNLNVTSNANTFRMRLYWADIKHDKWEILAGQSWSLMTPNRVGLSPKPSDIFYTVDMDTNYQVGLVWSRQPGFRLVYHADGGWTLGVAAENPQQFVTSGVNVPSAYTSLLDANGSGGSTATPNIRPDFIAKAAYDTDIEGKHMHVEIAGLNSAFKVERPSLTSAGTANGFGGSVNTILDFAKNAHFIFNSFYSDGAGRYLYGLGPDVVVDSNGNLSPVHGFSGLSGVEYQVNPTSMVYGYYGGVYFNRNYSGLGTTASPFYGFGYPGSSTSANRMIQEPTLGYINTFWKKPHYGALQLITQLSLVTRYPWAYTGIATKDTHTYMLFGDLRYVLP